MLQSLLPIALGHALAIAIVAGAIVALGVFVSPDLLRALAGSILVLWALYHAVYGSRHRARVGMRAGFAGLLLWSFLMAGAHGAGLMVAPALMPLCADLGGSVSSGPLAMSMLAVAVHTAAMLIVTAAIAVLVYEWIGVDFLRRGWFNLDRLWTAALVATGLQVSPSASKHVEFRCWYREDGICHYGPSLHKRETALKGGLLWYAR